MNARRSRGRILIVDEEEGIRALLARLVRQEGYEPLEAVHGEEALAGIRRDAPDALVLDVRTGADGMQVLECAKRLDPDLPVVIITSHGASTDAVAALRAGAHDYLFKPFDHGDVIRSLHSAITNRELRRTLGSFSDQASVADHLREMMGPSDAMSGVCSDIATVARCDVTVLIIGEPGTGKELVARAIHQVSRRARAPFVAVHCGAIPETIFESELFGHQKGAFTGAHESEPGKLEIARGGTVFLDEISNSPLGLQAKLLRALQERTICRLASTTPIQVDARLLVATQEDLEAAAAKGTFRKDLFFCLNEFAIRIPPLRERREDIKFLARRFLGLTNLDLGKSVAGFSDAAMEHLLVFDWPGNVRQLRSTIRRAALLADTVVDERHLGVLA